MYERALYPTTERKPRFRFQNAREIHGLPTVEGEVFDLAARAVASADGDRVRIRNYFLVSIRTLRTFHANWSAPVVFVDRRLAPVRYAQLPQPIVSPAPRLAGIAQSAREVEESAHPALLIVYATSSRATSSSGVAVGDSQ